MIESLKTILSHLDVEAAARELDEARERLQTAEKAIVDAVAERDDARADVSALEAVLTAYHRHTGQRDASRAAAPPTMRTPS